MIRPHHHSHHSASRHFGHRPSATRMAVPTATISSDGDNKSVNSSAPSYHSHHTARHIRVDASSPSATPSPNKPLGPDVSRHGIWLPNKAIPGLKPYLPDRWTTVVRHPESTSLSDEVWTTISSSLSSPSASSFESSGHQTSAISKAQEISAPSPAPSDLEPSSDLESPSGPDYEDDGQQGYTDYLRPQTFYSPPQGPGCDLVGPQYEGNWTYHLYYPYVSRDGSINSTWGHATSQDQGEMKVQAPALFPPEPKAHVIPGDVVLDVNNTSGFFGNRSNGVVALVTIARPTRNEASSLLGSLSQVLAYSDDCGYTFQYGGGEALFPHGAGSRFVGPRLARYEDKWVATVAYLSEPVIGFFTSHDLKTWTHASNFWRQSLIGADLRSPGLVRLPVRSDDADPSVHHAWLLVVSVRSAKNPGGGVRSHYFVGDFDGKSFRPYPGAAHDFPHNRTGSGMLGHDEARLSVDSLPKSAYLVNSRKTGWALALGEKSA